MADSSKSERPLQDKALGGDSRKTQRSRILRLLIDARGAWIPLPEIMACAAQYNARIFELRRLGFKIENRTEEIDGARHSWFRLVNSSLPSDPLVAATLSTRRAASSSGDWYESTTGKKRAANDPPRDLGPLFQTVTHG